MKKRKQEHAKPPRTAKVEPKQKLALPGVSLDDALKAALGVPSPAHHKR